MVIHKEVRGTILTKGLLEIDIPPTGRSYNWKHWQAVLDLKTCKECVENHGQIYEMNAWVNQEPPIHFACRCVIEAMKSVIAGKGTKDGIMVRIGKSSSKEVCLSIIFQVRSFLRWGGGTERHRRSLHQAKWQQWVYIRIKTDIFLMHPGGSGTKQTSTTTAADGTHIESFGQMMD